MLRDFARESEQFYKHEVQVTNVDEWEAAQERAGKRKAVEELDSGVEKRPKVLQDMPAVLAPMGDWLLKSGALLGDEETRKPSSAKPAANDIKTEQPKPTVLSKETPKLRGQTSVSSAGEKQTQGGTEEKTPTEAVKDVKQKRESSQRRPSLVAAISSAMQQKKAATAPTDLVSRASEGAAAAAVDTTFDCEKCGVSNTTEEALKAHLTTRVHKILEDLRGGPKPLVKTPLSLLHEYSVKQRAEVRHVPLCSLNELKPAAVLALRFFDSCWLNGR